MIYMVEKMIAQKQGFQFFTDIAQQIFKIRVWGYWGTELGKRYVEELHAQIKKLPKNRTGWHLLMDVSEYLPQLPEIQDLLDEGMVILDQHHILKRAILVDGPIMRFSTRHSAQEIERPVYSYFRSEEDAVRWLLGEMRS